jgi:hypothetical protein
VGETIFATSTSFASIGESLPLVAIAAAIPEGEDTPGVEVEREEGLNADITDWVGLIPAATAAANEVASPEPRRAAAVDVTFSEVRLKSGSCIAESEAVETVAAALPINIGGREDMEREEGLGAVPVNPEGAEVPDAFVGDPSRISEECRFPSPFSVRSPSLGG